MTRQRSATSSAMVSFCSTSSTEMPRRLSSRRYSATSSTIFGARPSVGSSMMIRSGSPISVRHSVSICCSPPDSTPASVCWRSLSRGNMRTCRRTTSAAFAGALLAQHQVLVHRQRGKDVPALGHIADAQVGDLVGFAAQHLLPFPDTRALALDQAHDGLGRGRTARAVAPEQATISPSRTSKFTPCSTWLLP
jgi:hypothetical protein